MKHGQKCGVNQKSKNEGAEPAGSSEKVIFFAIWVAVRGFRFFRYMYLLSSPVFFYWLGPTFNKKSALYL
ncbi:hypothetical protein, partial [Mongoliibacter sp.]|uniref:hypothetical protein n=1 Tax=Mongoliibacter sp. TaxID=2022438 RepID=UPI0025E7AE73